MLLQRIYDDNLAQASYLVGCQATGEALVIDANRDVERYVRAAADAGLRITLVTETHIHADFVSGSRELAKRTGARLLLSAEGGEDWQYMFAEADGATMLHNGDDFRVGTLLFDVLHTPGHTPEHLTFLVTNTRASERPIAAFTGDFLFVGDVGRPDLLETAAGMRGTMDDSARTLFRSVRRFGSEQRDDLQLFPGHGAGSACGKALGAEPSSTLGREKLVNWAFATTDEDAFVATVLDGQPEPPAYFAVMKRVNRDGPAIREHRAAVPRLALDDLITRQARGDTLVDSRPAPQFAAAHIPGTINIPLGRSFSTWIGALVPYNAPFGLIVDANVNERTLKELSMIGLDDVAGTFDTTVIEQWTESGRATSSFERIGAEELAVRLATTDAQVVDVRGRGEWRAGHLPGVCNIPLGELRARAGELAAGPVVVHCQGGTRSAIASSLLHSMGRTNVADLEGGVNAWSQAGYAVTRDDAEHERGGR